MTVFAFDTERRTNAEMILHCAELGYLTDDNLILDPTYGLGNWWKLWTPNAGIETIRRHDLDPDKAPDGAMDFTAMPYDDGKFDVVAYDPPYKLNGTPTPEVDAAYGVHTPKTVEERLSLMTTGLVECIRVTKPRGIVLAKCQDQVVSGNVVWQTQIMASRATFLGCKVEDMLHVSSYRPQPPGRRQIHAARNYSTLLVIRTPRWTA